MTMVSVIIPTHNRPDLVSQAIRSVLAQSYRNLELIVVDDGSTDETRAAVQAFTDPRLRYIYQSNAGLAAARNTGIRASSGAWVAFLDDDDAWFAEKLAQQLAVSQLKPEVGLVNGGWVYVDALGAVLGQVTPWLWRPRLDLETWLVACPAVPSAVMVRRDWLERVGGFDEILSREACGAEDWDLWLRLSREGCEMVWTKELLCAYRIHAGSMSRNAVRQRQSAMLALDRFFASPDLSPEVHAMKARVYAQARLSGAARLYAAGMSVEASQDVAAALALDPALMDNHGDGLIGKLMGWISDPLIGDPVQYVIAVFDHLPAAAAPHFARRRKSALALAAKQALFNAHFRRDRRGVFRNAAILAANHPRMLADRGVVSALVQAVAGPRAAASLRRVIHLSNQTSSLRRTP